jgi:phosphate transport system substrate-binding protein
MRFALTSRVATAMLGVAVACSASAIDVTGAGAAFVFPIMSMCSADYSQATGKPVNYQPIGSSGGVAQVKAGTVDFGSSDKPLPAKELAAAGLVQFPSATGAVVPVTKVASVKSGAMKLDPDVLAARFLGRITTRKGPRIAASSGGLTLPTQRITVVRRSAGRARPSISSITCRR